MKYLTLIFALILLTTEAKAYVDPGSMAWLFQAILALLGGILVFFKSIITKIKQFLLSIKNIFKKKKKTR